MIFSQLKELLLFTRNERNGILILLSVLLCCIALNFVLPYLVPDQKYDIEAWSREVEKYVDTSKPIQEVPVSPVFEGWMDPNLALLPELQRLGIPDKLAANWVKYIQKGGHFRKKEEVRKLYGMNDDLYKKVEPHLRIAESSSATKLRQNSLNSSRGAEPKMERKDSIRKSSGVEKRTFTRVEINKADSVQLESLPGIGPVLASRIIKYRKWLGGYYAVNQLKEIYGMSEELWDKSSGCLTVDSLEVKKIDINFLSVAELGRHPYIGFRQAKRVVRQRDKAGKFVRKEELAYLFSPDSLRKLLPYLMIGGSGN